MANSNLTSPLMSPVAREPAASAISTRAPAWLREPLLHFLLLGVLLFVIDHFIAARAGDPRVIVMDARVDQEAKQTFRASRGREPDERELKALRQVWLDNEVLYREGLALQVDKGDPAIRERVIFKALSIVDANVKLPAYDDRVLRTWFETHRAKYDDPGRYDFEEAVLAGANSESAVRQFVSALNAGTPGDAQAGLRVFKGRPYPSVVQSYGEDFAKALQTAPVGQWLALPTREGWRAIQLTSSAPAKPAAFDALRNAVLQDWTDATMAEQRSAAVHALAKKYTIQIGDAGK